MKQGTLYAARVRKAYARLRAQLPKPELPETDEPLRRMAIAVFGVRLGDVAAESAINRLLSRMVDWNEIRVSHVSELYDALQSANPAMHELCQRLREALQAVFQRENAMSLERLKRLGLREARQYLEELKGIDAYAVASVCLWSLGGHGMPVDDRVLRAMREAELVHPEANREEIQAFLERNISSADAKEFCVLMRSFSPDKAAGKREGAKRDGRDTSKKKKA